MMSVPAPAPPSSLVDLLDRHRDRYDGVLLDAYGVLNDARGVLPGARELFAALDARGLPFAVVTNDASRLPATCARRFAGMGLDVPADRVITSGSLLAPWLRERGLADARVMVVGTDDSRDYVAAAGCAIAPLDERADIDVLAVCDDAGYEFLDGIEAALNAALRALDAGRPLALVLPNPDLCYPKGDGAIGFTAGAIALLIEAALMRCHPDAPHFVHLGKPERHLFDAAARLFGTRRLLMVGDQLETDIAGARAAGLDAALIAGPSAISRAAHAARTELAPTYVIDALA
jgi:HAD superfamily hydrolase (TIGR01450 family)